MEREDERSPLNNRVERLAAVKVAISAIKQFTFDVVVSEIGMPGEDGYALIRQVRSLKPEQGGRIPAAALTVYAREEERTRALLSGFQLHIN